MGIERHAMNTTEQQEALLLSKWYEEEGGFAQGTKAPHKWVLRAESELRRQNARIAGLEVVADVAIEHIAELEQDRLTRIRQNDRMAARIADLEAQLSVIGAGGVEPLRGSRHAHECREALAACINLLRKTPKITRDIYVGKDRQAWGVQAKAVLDAAVAALNNYTEKPEKTG